jgi:hypothetical protein
VSISAVDATNNNSNTFHCAPQTNLTTLLPVVPPPSRRQTSSADSTGSSARWQHEFSVCVAVSFGSLPPDEVIEWVEANRMFGVTKFNIYDAKINDSRTLDVLKFYVRLGLVEINELPPGVDDFSINGIKLSSPTSLNDCMMRYNFNTEQHYKRAVCTPDNQHSNPPVTVQLGWPTLTAYGQSLEFRF